MVWTEITRRQYRRKGLRYESDTTEGEWLAMEPLLPPASALGRPRATDMRTVIDAILYIASTGCQWRQLPKDFPPYSFAWLGRCRRLAKDFEATIASAVAWALVAHIRTLTRRLARRSEEHTSEL